MKILFLSYGGHNCNSLSHVAGFARELVQITEITRVTIGLPGERWEEAELAQLLKAQHLDHLAGNPRFDARGHGELLAAIRAGEGFDIIHLWTPREINRRWLQGAAQAWVPEKNPWPAVFVHLEDSEESIAERAFGSRQNWEAQAQGDSRRFPLAFSHPEHYRSLLALADQATVIWETLGKFVPPTTPVLELFPGIDLETFAPRPADLELKKKLGLNESGVDGKREIIVCYTGNTNVANVADMVALYTALHVLRVRHGWPIRLLRAGADTVPLRTHLGFELDSWVTEIGFVPHNEVPAILNLAHLFIQPGAPDEFNDFRLPSKLPEYLASGGTCFLPASNIGLRLRDGEEAIILQRGDSEEMVARVDELLRHPDKYQGMGLRGRAFVQRHFDPARQAALLLDAYSKAVGLLKAGESQAGLAMLAGKGMAPGHGPDLLHELAAARAGCSLLYAQVVEEAGELPRVRKFYRGIRKTAGRLYRKLRR
jgi:glycosyltransferase involved in cell wall biosynthesis